MKGRWPLGFGVRDAVEFGEIEEGLAVGVHEEAAVFADSEFGERLGLGGESGGEEKCEEQRHDSL